MKIQINKPTDVYKHIGKTYANASLYSELLASCGKELVDLGVELNQFADFLHSEQRECMICLECLQSSSTDSKNNHEIERQRQQYLSKIELCKQKSKQLRMISEEYSVLVRESQKIQQDAQLVVNRMMEPVVSVRKLINRFLSSL